MQNSASKTICHETEIKICGRLATDTVTSTLHPTTDNSVSVTHSNNVPAASNSSTLMGCLDLLRSQEKVEKSVKSVITPGVQSAKILLARDPGSQVETRSQETNDDQVTATGMCRIDDLCSKIRAAEAEPPQSCIGQFMDDQSHYTVFTVSRQEDCSSNNSNLHDLLCRHQAVVSSSGSSIPVASGMCLSKRARLQLAVTLASTALQLHTTPWLGDDWNGKRIRFRQESIDRPYVSRAFPKTDIPPGANPNATSCLIRNQCMFGLGVLLLELSIGKPLEHYQDPEQPLSL